MRRRSSEDDGSMTAFVAVTAVALLMVTGMVYDGGQVVAAQARAQSDAAKAARAGAQEIDLTSLRSSGTAVLDPVAAEQSAQAYLDAAGATGSVTVSGSQITVTVTITQDMQILPLPDRSIAATETATALEEESP